jgi:hypothetical protein
VPPPPPLLIPFEEPFRFVQAVRWEFAAEPGKIMFFTAVMRAFKFGRSVCSNNCCKIKTSRLNLIPHVMAGVANLSVYCINE